MIPPSIALLSSPIKAGNAIDVKPHAPSRIGTSDGARSRSDVPDNRTQSLAALYQSAIPPTIGTVFPVRHSEKFGMRTVSCLLTLIAYVILGAAVGVAQRLEVDCGTSPIIASAGEKCWTSEFRRTAPKSPYTWHEDTAASAECAFRVELGTVDVRRRVQGIGQARPPAIGRGYELRSGRRGWGDNPEPHAVDRIPGKRRPRSYLSPTIGGPLFIRLQFAGGRSVHRIYFFGADSAVSPLWRGSPGISIGGLFLRPPRRRHR